MPTASDYKGKGGVKFIRVRGKVVPIRGDGSAPKGAGISKRYGAKKEKAPPVKRLPKIAQRAIQAAGIAGGALALRGSAASAISGALIGGVFGHSLSQIGFTKKARGETPNETSFRAAYGNDFVRKMKNRKKK